MGLVFMTLSLAVALVLTSEVMYRYGLSRAQAYDEAHVSQISTVQAATLGLLALCLGFTMSMAEGRFNTRRQILVGEANAIATTWLRADFLPDAARVKSRELLLAYVESRRVYFGASFEAAPAATAHSQALADELWSVCAEVVRAHRDWGDTLATYVEALGDLINFEATRDLAIRARVPGLIDALLILVAFTAMGVTGFATGVSRRRTALSLYVVPVLIAVACGVINDLDRTRFGLVSSGDGPMERLQKRLEDQRVTNASR